MESRSRSRGAAPRTGVVEAAPLAVAAVEQADSARVRDVALAAGSSAVDRWEEAALGLRSEVPQMRPSGQVVLPVPAVGAGVEQGAGGSSSHQPATPEGPEEWGPGLNQPGFPDTLVWHAEAEKNLWQEFYQVGLSVQNALHHAFTLHTNNATQIYQVCVFVFMPFPFLCSCSCFIWVLFLFWAATVDAGGGQGLLSRRPTRPALEGPSGERTTGPRGSPSSLPGGGAAGGRSHV
jgi:hypothetical protein